LEVALNARLRAYPVLAIGAAEGPGNPVTDRIGTNLEHLRCEETEFRPTACTAPTAAPS
jgi:hypothetical protein